MAACRALRLVLVLALSFGPSIGLGGAALAAETREAAPAFEVMPQEIDDLKSVYATVRSRDLIQARVRTPGTIDQLKIDEGDFVKQGEVLALVTDPKLGLRIKALDARIVADESRLETAKTELARSKTLQERGFASQSRLDQAQTAYDVAANELKSARADRSVIETESQEGEVLAPTSGRVLKVPVTVGSVVLAGESIATIAANEYLLRLELPERHARFMKVGDKIRLGARGLGPDEGPLAEGRISQVYPELQDGRVVADAEVPDLGSYFVGERVLVWISAGKRQTFVVPRAYVFKRFGLDYVRLKKDDGSLADVVVQTGRDVKDAGGKDKVEILAGVAAGDKLVQP
jgi:RND family efflux transporter MFP subunit